MKDGDVCMKSGSLADHQKAVDVIKSLIRVSKYEVPEHNLDVTRSESWKKFVLDVNAKKDFIIYEKVVLSIQFQTGLTNLIQSDLKGSFRDCLIPSFHSLKAKK